MVKMKGKKAEMLKGKRAQKRKGKLVSDSESDHETSSEDSYILTDPDDDSDIGTTCNETEEEEDPKERVRKPQKIRKRKARGTKIVRRSKPIDMTVGVGATVKVQGRVLQAFEDKYGKEKQPNVNCRVEAFGIIVSALNKRKKEIVQEMGFGSLLHFCGKSFPRHLFYWLMTRFDPYNMVLVAADDRTKFKLSKVQVNWVLGIPCDGIPIPRRSFGTALELENELYEKYATFFGKGHGGEGVTRGITTNTLQALVSKDMVTREDEKEFRLGFLMYALATLLCPNTCHRFPASLMPAVTIYETSASYDWCDLVLTTLGKCGVNFAKKFYKNGYVSGVGGCTYFLAILYLDRLASPPIRWGVFPRIKVWKLELVNLAKNEDRIPNGDFGATGVYDLAYGERHPDEARDTLYKPDGGTSALALEIAGLLLPLLKGGGQPSNPDHDFSLENYEPRKKRMPTSNISIYHKKLKKLKEMAASAEIQSQNSPPRQIGKHMSSPPKSPPAEKHMSSSPPKSPPAEKHMCSSPPKSPPTEKHMSSSPPKSPPAENQSQNSQPPQTQNRMSSSPLKSGSEKLNSPALQQPQSQNHPSLGPHKSPTKTDNKPPSSSESFHNAQEHLHSSSDDDNVGTSIPISPFKQVKKCSTREKRTMKPVAGRRRDFEYGKSKNKFSAIETALLKIVDDWATCKRSKIKKPALEELIECKGQYVEIGKCYNVIKIKEDVPNQYVTVAARLYTKYWSEKLFANRGTMRLFIEPSFSDCVLRDPVIQTPSSPSKPKQVVVLDGTEGKHNIPLFITPEDDGLSYFEKQCAHIVRDLRLTYDVISPIQICVVFVPILKENHWWCAAFNVHNKEVWLMDSMYVNDGLEEHDDEFNSLCTAMDQLFKTMDDTSMVDEISNWTRKQLSMTVQPDIHSCGVYMLEAIKQCADRYVEHFDLGDVAWARRRLLCDDVFNECNELLPTVKEVLSP